jgi:hypothetical protein
MADKQDDDLIPTELGWLCVLDAIIDETDLAPGLLEGLTEADPERAARLCAFLVRIGCATIESTQGEVTH